LLIARYLDSSEFGLFALVFTYLELFRTVADFGVEPVLIRRMVVDRSAWPGLLKSAIALKLCLATTASLLALALSGLFGYGDSFRSLLPLAIPSLFATSATNVLTVPYFAGLALHRISGIWVASGALYIAAILGGGIAGFGIHSFIILSVAYDCMNLIGVFLVSRRKGEIRSGACTRVLVDILWEAKAPALASFFVTSYVRVGILLVGVWGDMRTVGNFALATRLAEGFKLISGALATSTFPLFTRFAKSGSRKEINRFFYTLCGLLAGGMVIVALLVQYWLRSFLPIVFPRYGDLGSLLVPLTWAMVFVFVNMQASALFSGFGFFWLTTCAAAINFVISMVANTMLIPTYGGIGASWAYLLTEGVNSSFQLPAATALLVTRHGRLLQPKDIGAPE